MYVIGETNRGPRPGVHPVCCTTRGRHEDGREGSARGDAGAETWEMGHEEDVEATAPALTRHETRRKRVSCTGGGKKETSEDLKNKEMEREGQKRKERSTGLEHGVTWCTPKEKHTAP